MATTGYLPPVVVEILASDRGFVATLARDKALLENFAREQTNARLGADTRVFQTDLTTARAELLTFAREVTNARLGVDAAPFWAEIETLRAQLAAASPLDVNIDLNTNSALAQIAALRGTLAMSQVGQMGGGGADNGLGALLGAGGGGAANSLLTAAGLFHTMHLFAPELLGLGAALFSVGAGFAALGIASIGAATDIYTGVAAVGAATNAMAAAIPGTTAWQKGVVGLGAAWSAIPANLQPAVSAIRNFMSQLGSSPAATEIQGFLGGQANILTGLFHAGSSTFQPLILATQRAIVTVEGMFKSGLGGGSLASFVSSIAKMVGPALVELVQLAGAIFKIAAGFAKAVNDGQGMEIIVGMFQNLARIVNSGFFQGFIAGWVDLDRILSTFIGWIADAIGGVGNLGSAMTGVGTVIGFAASAFLTLKAAAFLANTNLFGASAGAKAFGSAVNGMTTKMIGFGLLAAGITGLVSSISQLTGVSDPLTPLWNGIGGALGFVSKKISETNSTINGYTAQLNGAIPVTQTFSAAMDLLVRSEQSIGSGLESAVTGFAQFTAAPVMDYQKMIANLQQQNTSLAQWAADAQLLIKAGVDPSMVASMVSQSPAEVTAAWAQVQSAGTTAITQMNVTWAAKMLEAQMSGKQGIQGMVTAIEGALQTGTPTMKAAAAQVATTLGQQLNIPFDGSVASVQAIGNALDTLPTSVIQGLAGKMGSYTTKMDAAGTATQKTAAHTTSLSTKLLSMVGSLGMTVGGIAMLGGSFKGVVGVLGGVMSQIGLLPLRLAMFAGSIGKFAGAIGSGFVSAASSTASFVAKYAVQMAKAVAAGVVWLAEHAVMVATFVAQNIVMAASATAAFIAENAATLGIIVGIMALVAAAIYVGTHWRQVWTDIKNWFDDAVRFLRSGFGSLVLLITGPIAPLLLLALHWQQVWAGIKAVAVTVWHFLDRIWGDITNSIHSAWSSIINFFTGIPGKILAALGDLGTLLVNVGKNIITGLINGMKSMVKGAAHAALSVGKSVLHAVTSFFGVFSPSRVMAGVGSNITIGLGNGITASSGQAVAAAKRVATQVSQAFGSLSKASAVKTAVADLSGIFSNLASVFTNFQKAAANASNVGPSLTKMSGALTIMAAGMPAISGAVTSVVTAMSKLGSNKALTALPGIFSNLGKVFTSFSGAAKASSAINGLAILQIVASSKLLSSSAPAITTNINGITGAFHALAKSKTVGPEMKALGGVFTDLSKLFTDMGNVSKAASGVTVLSLIAIVMGLDNVKSAAPLIVSAVQGIEKQFSKLGNMKKINSELNSVNTLFSTLSKVFGNLGKAAQGAASVTPAALDLITTAITQVGTALSKLPGVVAQFSTPSVNAFKTLGKTISDYLTKTLVPQLQGIGTSLMHGLAAGITAGAGAAVSAAQAVSAQVHAATKAANQVNSPSLLYAVIGTELMEGLALGIFKGAPLARSAMAGSMNGVRPSMAGMSGMSGTGTGSPIVIHQGDIHITAPTGQASEIGGVLQKAIATQNQQLIARLRSGTTRMGAAA